MKKQNLRLFLTIALLGLSQSYWRNHAFCLTLLHRTAVPWPSV